tara:strand:- start:624 stop:974 length:351 start_codon:yes stop_codon:yes gene_type:complete
MDLPEVNKQTIYCTYGRFVMKINKKQLKQIIKEEVDKIININFEDDPDDPKPTVGGIEGYYATKSWELRQASRRINKIKSALEDAKSAGDSAAVKELEKQLKVANAKYERAAYTGD